MENVWPATAACAGIASLFPVLMRFRRGVRHTALESVWPCALVVWLAWLIVAGIAAAENFTRRLPLRAWVDVLWYLAAVLALLPPVAVLGARRPTSRVWAAFVLIPLVLVFAWPVLPELRTFRGPVAFTLESPILVGFVVVVAMGAGNYLGLRFSLSAFLWIAGLLMVVLPLCPATKEWVFRTDVARSVGALCLVAAAWSADRKAAAGTPRAPLTDVALDRVWRDFRDLFGIVWTRRVQERFNDEARKQQFPVRLGIDGLEPADDVGRGSPDPAEVADRRSPRPYEDESLIAAESSLRWLLQKFVDRDWIDQRMSSARAAGNPAPAVETPHVP